MGKLYNKNVVHFSDSSTGLMSLYQAGDKNSKGNKPLIFIRGHAGRWTVNTKEIPDNAPYNMKLVKQHEGFWYNDKIHFPLIAEYSYKDNMKKHLREYKKSELTTASFSEAIIEMLEKEGLDRVDMVGASVGANVAMLCSKSDRVDRVSVISPAMPYSYLADIDALTKSKNQSLLDRIMYIISKVYLDQEYGFVFDMNQSFRNPQTVLEMIDASKIYLSAGDVTNIMSKGIKGKILEIADLLSVHTITKATSFPSDGAMVTDESYYKKLGIGYEIDHDNYHIYCDQKEYLLKRAYLNLERIKPYTKGK